MAHSKPWDSNFENTPTSANLLGQVAAFVQATRALVRQRFHPEHFFSLDPANDASQGVHKVGSARVWVGASEPATPQPDYATEATDAATGRVLVDTAAATIKVQNGTAWQGLVTEAATATKIPVRNSSGEVLTATPAAGSPDTAAANKKYVGDTDTATRSWVETQLETLASALIPVGFVYVQYPWQDIPANLYAGRGWSWLDITSNFAGAFFRSEGGLSEAFRTSVAAAQGFAQQNLSGWFHVDQNGQCDGTLFKDGGDAPGKSGQGTGVGRLVNFNASGQITTAAEVRPKNFAIRIWKRTA